jgi:HEAT repeat protein
MGEKAFPDYEAILSDPTADSNEVGRALFILCNVNADRRRFVKHALSRLTDAKSGVRLNAAALLGQIGTATDSSPVVALLSDEYVPVVRSAARTLVAIGSQREVVAMDVWLRGVSHRNDPELRQYVKQCRDALKKRLDEAPKKAT